MYSNIHIQPKINTGVSQIRLENNQNKIKAVRKGPALFFLIFIELAKSLFVINTLSIFYYSVQGFIKFCICPFRL